MPIKVILVEDDEIRSQIREMVVGQLKTLVREEVRSVIDEEVGTRINTHINRDVLRSLAGTKIHNTWFTSTAFREEVGKIVRENYSKYIDEKMGGVDFEALAMTLVRENIGKVKR